MTEYSLLPELWRSIFGYLPCFNLCRVVRVCKYWQRLLDGIFPFVREHTVHKRYAGHAVLLNAGDFISREGGIYCTPNNSIHASSPISGYLLLLESISLFGNTCCIRWRHLHHNEGFWYFTIECYRVGLSAKSKYQNASKPTNIIIPLDALLFDEETVLRADNYRFFEHNIVTHADSVRYDHLALKLLRHPAHPNLFFALSASAVFAYRRGTSAPIATYSPKSPQLWPDSTLIHFQDGILVVDGEQLVLLDIPTLHPKRSFEMHSPCKEIQASNLHVFAIRDKALVHWCAEGGSNYHWQNTKGVLQFVLVGDYYVVARRSKDVILCDMRQRGSISVFFKGAVHSLDHRDGHLLIATFNSINIFRLC